MRIALLICTLLLAACGEAERIAEQFRPAPATPHERYARVLEDAGLLETALGRDWLAAADSALVSPVPVSLPYRERAYFSRSEATAGSWSFTARRGERVRITLAREDTSTFAVFADLYEMPEDSTESPERRAWADSLAMGFMHDARSDARFVLRVQPELLRTGSVTVTIERGPSLAFPVQDRDTRAIQSFWGAGRDGGRRSHEGVDIFAARGTPVLASVDGVVRSTRPNNLGGIVLRAPGHAGSRARPARSHGRHARLRGQLRQCTHYAAAPALRRLRARRGCGGPAALRARRSADGTTCHRQR